MRVCSLFHVLELVVMSPRQLERISKPSPTSN